MDKVLIIEDNEADFIKVNHCLTQQHITTYPSNVKEFNSFSDLLVKWAMTRDKSLFEAITNTITEKASQYFIIDINLIMNDDSDKSGLEIKDFITNTFPDSKQFIYTKYSDVSDIGYYEGLIKKNGSASVEEQLKDKLIDKYLTANLHKVDSSILYKKYRRPEVLQKLGDFEHYKILPWASFIIDKVITYLFYFLLIFLFVAAPIYIFVKICEHKEMIQIAEFAFIAFLPFLITCGFFIFYTKSLRPYFLSDVVDPRKEDFDSASVLMKLTKKLFISSLLSYLFIKLIELLCFEQPEMDKKYFQEFYGTDNQFIQLYFLIGLIVTLLLYYIYIDKNHDTKTLEKNSSPKKIT